MDSSKRNKIKIAVDDTAEMCNEMMKAYRRLGWDKRDAIEMAGKVELFIFESIFNSGGSSCAD